MAEETIGILAGALAEGRISGGDLATAGLAARRIAEISESRGLSVLLILAHDTDEAIRLVTSSGVLGGARPVIAVLLDSGDSQDRGTVLEAGADDCLTQPVSARELGARLGRLMGIHSLATESVRYSATLARELNQARRIQQYIMPLDPPQIEGATIAARYLPTSQLGGDLFDIVRLDEHRVGLFMADVAGHGVGAALNTMLIKSQLVIWARPGITVTETLSLLNNYLCPLVDLRHATAIYAVYDRRSHEFEYSLAGHLCPVLIREGQPARQMALPEIPDEAAGMKVGLPLGMFEDCMYMSHREVLEPGDRLFLYTDGLIEWRVSEGTMLGIKGLCALLDQSRQRSVSDQVSWVVDHLCSEAGAQSIIDDINLLAMQVE